jgi:hypothetical protein
MQGGLLAFQPICSDYYTDRDACAHANPGPEVSDASGKGGPARPGFPMILTNPCLAGISRLSHRLAQRLSIRSPV